MTPQDAPEFLSRLTALAELFKEDLSVAAQTLYFDALSDADIVQVIDALNSAVKTCKFFPRPVELRDHIFGAVEEHAEEAWLEYKSEARRLGGYRTAEFHAVTADTIIAVLWASKRKEWERTFRSIANRTRLDAPTKRLLGFVERENELRGYHNAERLLSDGTADTSHRLDGQPETH